MIKKIIAFVLIAASTSAFALSTGPAPSGDPKTVATKAIKEAEHPCPKVKSAKRNPDGSVSAVCSNKEDYLVFTVDSKTITMRCSAARKIGVAGC
jgi:hypothetical protein